MSPLCTSFPFELRRVARSRASRVLVCLLAFVLSIASGAAVTMPLSAEAAGTAAGDAARAPASAHEHCAERQTPASHAAKPAAHDADGMCCVGKSCACVHACDVPFRVVTVARSPISGRTFIVLPPRVHADVGAPPLRPPIA